MKIKLPSLPSLKLRRDPDPAPSTSGIRASAPLAAPAAPDVAITGLGDRMRLVNRRLRGMAGYAFLFLFVFFVFVWVSLPTRAIAWKAGQLARENGYIVDIEDASISPFGGVTLYNVRWTFQPSHAGQVPRTLILDEVEVDVGVLGLLFGSYDVTLDTKIDEAPVHAEYARSDEESTVKISITDLALYDVPKLQQSVNAPLKGLFALEVDLTMPENKFAKAQGSITLSCAACTIGDDVTPLFMPGSSGLMAKGVTLPEIDLGSLGGKLVVENGKATAEKFETDSDDLTVKITGGMKLADPFTKSELELDLKLLVKPKLQDRSEPLKLMVQTAGPSTKLDGADEGWMGFKLRGSPGKPKFTGLKAKSREERQREQRQKALEREAKRKAKKPTVKKEPEKEPESAEKAELPENAGKPVDDAAADQPRTDEKAEEKKEDDRREEERREEEKREADKREEEKREEDKREAEKAAEQPEEKPAEEKPAEEKPAEENPAPEAPKEGEGGGEGGGGGGEAQ